MVKWMWFWVFIFLGTHHFLVFKAKNTTVFLKYCLSVQRSEWWLSLWSHTHELVCSKRKNAKHQVAHDFNIPLSLVQIVHQTHLSNDH